MDGSEVWTPVDTSTGAATCKDAALGAVHQFMGSLAKLRTGKEQPLYVAYHCIYLASPGKYRHSPPLFHYT